MNSPSLFRITHGFGLAKFPPLSVTPKPKVVAKPKAEPVEEDIPEPTVKHSKKPIVESKVENLVAEWDD